MRTALLASLLVLGGCGDSPNRTLSVVFAPGCDRGDAAPCPDADDGGADAADGGVDSD